MVSELGIPAGTLADFAGVSPSLAPALCLPPSPFSIHRPPPAPPPELRLASSFNPDLVNPSSRSFGISLAASSKSQLMASDALSLSIFAGESQAPVATPAFRAFVNNITETVRSGLSTRRPWSELVDRSAFSKPESITDAVSRIRKNYSYFRVNYTTARTPPFCLPSSPVQRSREAHPSHRLLLLPSLLVELLLVRLLRSHLPLPLLLPLHLAPLEREREEKRSSSHGVRLKIGKWEINNWKWVMVSSNKLKVGCICIRFLVFSVFSSNLLVLLPLYTADLFPLLSSVRPS